ncbi:Formate/nitrite family of transporters [Thermoplasmatales archaeon BRNA1]|nr:Formate/nitrite family of transporters [Thermoplasmatales archaeon BRNA1]
MDASHYSKCLLRAILAGMAIGMGGCVFMALVNTDYRWVGAVLFSIGLFAVFTFGFDLYTGKVGYAVENPPSYIVDLVVIILGNFVGALITGYMIPMSDASVVSIVDARLTDDIDFFRVFCKGVFCGILMFIAADYYKTRKQYLATFICVPVFILAGFEHSIADMFYFCSAQAFTFDALLFILVVILGNAVGGILIPLCRKYMYEDAPAKSGN